jgi:hypothetical protein
VARLTVAEIADLRRLLNEANMPQAINSDPAVMSEGEYELARKVTEVMRAEIVERRARWTEAVANLTKGLISGKVISVLQSVKGGGLSEPLPRTDWIVHDPDVLLWRFALCALDEAKRFELTPYSPDTHRLIYITAESLNAFQAGPLAELFGKPPIVASVTTVQAPVPEPLAKEPRPASPHSLGKTLKRAIQYMKESGHAEPTREEATDLLAAIHGSTTRDPIRKVVADTIPAKIKRRTQRQLVNRDKELEDCRRFLEMAT